MQTHIKKPSLEINFTYLGNTEIYCIFKTCCTIPALFSTQRQLFHKPHAKT